MAQTEVRDRHREAAEDEHQRAVGQRNILSEELSTGAGQANRGYQTGQENQHCQQEATRTAKGVLHVSMQNGCAVSILIDQGRAIRTQAEQRQIQQRQSDTGHQASPDGVASQQARFGHTARTRGVNDDDTKDHRAHSVHSQIAIHEPVGECRRFVGVQRFADRTRRPHDGRHGQHDQRQNFHRCQEVAHGIQQFARIEGDQNHQREVNQAINQQRQRAVTGQRRNPDFKRDGCSTRGRKQRADRQIADRRQQNTRHFTDRGAETIDAATDFRQRHDGQNR
ncbi:hypothetical protein D3C80_386790 [compost metagenome]